MNTTLFENLLDKDESTTLDFKSEFYKFTDKTDRERKKYENSEFIKDIAAFYNTIRNEDSYIIFGVDVKNGIKELKGIDRYYDNAKLQQKIENILNPIPRFDTQFFYYQEKQFCIIKIPIPIYTKPSIVTKDYGILKKNATYIRANSSTKEANSDELEQIYSWLKQLSETRKNLKNTEEELIKLIDEGIDNNEELYKDYEGKIYNEGELLGMTINEVELLIKKRRLRKRNRSQNVSFILNVIIFGLPLFLLFSYCVRTVFDSDRKQKTELREAEINDSLAKIEILKLIKDNSFEDAKNYLRVKGNSYDLIKKVIDSEINFHLSNQDYEKALIILNNYDPIQYPIPYTSRTLTNRDHEISWFNSQIRKIVNVLIENDKFQEASEITITYYKPKLIIDRDLKKHVEDNTEQQKLLDKIKLRE